MPRLDMAPLIPIHPMNLQTRKVGIKKWGVPAEEKRALLRFLEELELGKVNKGKRISEARQCKYLAILRPSLEFFRKPTAKLSARDIEALEKALADGTIKSTKGRPYVHSVRVDMRS